MDVYALLIFPIVCPNPEAENRDARTPNPNARLQIDRGDGRYFFIYKHASVTHRSSVQGGRSAMELAGLLVQSPVRWGASCNDARKSPFKWFNMEI